MSARLIKKLHGYLTEVFEQGKTWPGLEVIRFLWCAANRRLDAG